MCAPSFPYKWVMVSSDSSEVEMELFLDSQKRWVKKASQHQACQVCPVRFTEHTEHYAVFQCNSPSCAAVARGLGVDRCNWFVRTMLCDLTKRGTIDQHGQHLSTTPDEVIPKLNFTMKRFIRDKVKDKFKGSRILNAMIDAGFFSTNALELKDVVKRYAYNYRIRGLGDNNDVSEMERLLAGRQYHSSLPDDAAFGFGFPTGASGKPSLSTGAKTPVVIGFATKHSIRTLALGEQYPLHVDATFKLNTARFPSIVVGLSDARRQFHPVAFFIVSNLQQPVLEVVFGKTFEMYRTVTGKLARISYTMADADVAQRNALDTVIAEDLDQRVPPVHLMCFFHVMQNVRKYMSSVPRTLRPRVLKHVYQIHYARSQLGSTIVSSKPSKTGRCFVTPAGYAKTNNPVETFNKEIKRDYSLRSLVSVNALAQAFLDMCYHRACRARPFATTPAPSNKQASRFRALDKQGRLEVLSHYRSSVAFMLEGGQRKIFRVVQRGVDTPWRARKTPLTATEELQKADEHMETEDQPSMGWLVDVDAGSCECRNWRKFGYCVHLIAARLYEDLLVEGVKTKRTFAIQGKALRQGRRPEVGHALAFE